MNAGFMQALCVFTVTGCQRCVERMFHRRLHMSGFVLDAGYAVPASGDVPRDLHARDVRASASFGETLPLAAFC